MDKKKYDVSIADVEMSIISDEREEFVMKLVEKLDSEIRDILAHSKRSTKVDAALLLALDYSCGKAKAEKRCRNLEAQIALYDANLRRMREENIKLRSALLGKKDASKLEELAEEPAVEIPELGDEPEEEETAEAEAPVSQLTIADEPAEETPSEAPSDAREDKLRQIGQIADLLRKKDN